tara:strand:+ start:89095 stop:89916 length:822 start_codon:yes stop_codon:yes gene_type:complete
MSYKLLNLACGSKVSDYGDWINIDFKSPKPKVKEYNILNGLDFDDQFFDVVYSAQFIEHLTYKEAQKVLIDIARILKKGGFIRLVTPDLEELSKNYIKYLEELKVNQDKLIEEKYDWIRLEIFDQIVRDFSGGETSSFLNNCENVTKEYIKNRLGYSGNNLLMRKDNKQKTNIKLGTLIKNFYKIPRKINEKITSLTSSKNSLIGNFRKSGEVHRYLHDFYSLSRLLKKSGFVNIKRLDAYNSSIPSWSKYQLDIINNIVDAPLSLYIEAQII